MEKPDKCVKCGTLCVDRDNRIRGPLEGKYEWLCPACYYREEMVHYPMKYKKPS